MYILVRRGKVVDYCSAVNNECPYILIGNEVICETKSCTFNDCSIIEVPGVPDDIDKYDYYYEYGKFIRGELKTSVRLNRSTPVNVDDNNYTSIQARGSSLNSSETTPSCNGSIAWQYE